MLTEEQKESFANNGYIVLDKFFSETDLIEFRNMLIHIIKKYLIKAKEKVPDLIPENFEAIIEDEEMQISLKEINKEDINRNNFKLLNSLEEQEKKIVTTSSAVASLPDSINDNSINEIITLKFLNSTWVQLRDFQDKIILSKLMNKGDEYSYNLSDNFNLTAGNAGNIVIFIEGIPKGKAGKAGEVIESLIIDSKFKN